MDFIVSIQTLDEYNNKIKEKYYNETAEVIFKYAIHNMVEARVMMNESEIKTFQGRLISIIGNQFFIKIEDDAIKTFHYAMLLNLKRFNE